VKIFYHLRHDVLMLFWQPTYGNITACQLLSNLCVMIIYRQGSSSAPTACTLYLRKGVPGGQAFTESWCVQFVAVYQKDDHISLQHVTHTCILQPTVQGAYRSWKGMEFNI